MQTDRKNRKLTKHEFLIKKHIKAIREALKKARIKVTIKNITNF